MLQPRLFLSRLRGAIAAQSVSTARQSSRQNRFLSSRNLSSQPIAATNPYLPYSRVRPLGPAWRTGPLRLRRPNSTSHSSGKPQPQSPSTAAAPAKSLSERMKDMSRKYGWVVVGVYAGLSVLDFPFCLLAVRLFGVERVGQVERFVIDGFWGLAERVVPGVREQREQKERALATVDPSGAAPDASTSHSSGHHHGDASIWTQILLAYGVHKSLIFIRIPITLAITPKTVRTLQAWGWNVGRGAAKAS